MSCWNGIELDTPATILKDGNGYYDAGTDVFDEIIETAVQTFDNGALFKKALWWRFRNYIIGACDTEFWVQGMADRLDMVGRRWDEIFSRMLETDLTDLTDRAYNRTIKHTAIDGTEGDVRIITREGTDTLVNSKTGQDVEVLAKTGTDTVVDSKTGYDTETLARTGTDTLAKTGTETLVNSKTGEDTHTTEHESLPQTLTDTTKYLDARQTDVTTPGVETTDETTFDTSDETTHDTLDTRTVTPGVETTDETTHNTTDTRTVTPGVETTDETTHDTTDTDTYKPNTQDTENYEEFDTLNAVTFDSMVKAYPNVFIDFTDEFIEYFVARWY